MMGHGHVISGLLVGVLTLPVAPVAGTVEEAAWVAACGGLAQLPDWDQAGSRVGRMWGPLTDQPARLIGKVAQGHRWGTHDAVLGTGAFTLAAAAATWHPVTSAIVLALALGMAMRGLHFVIPGRTETTAIGNLGLSLLGAWFLLTYSTGTPTWLPLAVAVGCLTHQLGDVWTKDGLPIPVLWLLNRRARVALTPFRTGKGAETVVTVVLSVALVVALANHGGLIAYLAPHVIGQLA